MFVTYMSYLEDRSRHRHRHRHKAALIMIEFLDGRCLRLTALNGSRIYKLSCTEAIRSVRLRLPAHL